MKRRPVNQLPVLQVKNWGTGSAELHAQSLLSPKSRCWPGPSYLKVLRESVLQAHSDCWQNSFSCNRGTEIFFPAGSNPGSTLSICASPPADPLQIQSSSSSALNTSHPWNLSDMPVATNQPKDALCIQGLLWWDEGFPGGSEAKNPPAMQETQVQSLGWEESPGEGNSNPNSSVFAWRIPWTEEPGGLQSMGSQRVSHNLATKQQQSDQISPLLPGKPPSPQVNCATS